MSGGGSVNFQTPVPLYEAENQIFGSLPWANTSGQAQSGAYGGIGNLSSFLGGVPSTGQFNNQAANLGNAANSYLPQATALMGNATNASNAGNTVLNNMFNNQQGYYNQLQQQNTDQANAENAMAGVATTPYGAALANQSNLNFNNQWQSFLNSQQATAANTASSLYGSAANTLGAETSALNAAGGALNTAAGTQEGLQTQRFNAQQQQIQDYLNYILGNTQNSGAYTSAVNASTNAGAASTSSLAQAQQANNAGKSGIGSALGGIGSLVGNLIP